MEAGISTQTALVADLGQDLRGSKAALGKATSDKTHAYSDLSRTQDLHRKETDLCNANVNSLKEDIADATERADSLKTAIGILGGDSEGAKFMQLLSSKTAFLQVAEPLPLAKLESLLQKSSNKKVKALIQAAVSAAATQGKKASKSQEEALKTILGKIAELMNDLRKQNEADSEAKTWCKQQQNELENQIEGLKENNNAAATKAISLMATADSQKAQIVEVNDGMEKLMRENKEEHSSLMEERAATEEAIVSMKNDLKDLNTAKIKLNAKFEGRGAEGSTGNVVMDEINKVIAEYQNSLAEHERSIKKFNRGLDNAQSLYEEKLSSFEQDQKSFQKALETTVESHGKAANDVRNSGTQLKIVARTFHDIFQADDGKCLDYVNMYAARKADREGEMDNLDEARESLRKYCEGLGIRV